MLLHPLTIFFLPMWVAMSLEGIDGKPHGVIQSKVLSREHNLLGEEVTASGTLTRVLLYAQVNWVKWLRGGCLPSTTMQCRSHRKCVCRGRYIDQRRS
jgi:hypothetical protein